MAGATATRTKKRARKRSQHPRRKRRQAQRRVLSSKDLPSWSDLSGEKQSDAGQRRNTWQFILAVAVLAAGLTFYVGHVKSTQQLVVKLQEQRNLNQQLMMRKEHLSGAYDRATGPAVIYERAPQLGLQESSSPTYQLEPSSN